MYKILFHDLWMGEYRDYGQRNTREENMELWIHLLDEYQLINGIKENLEKIQLSAEEVNF